MATYARYRHEGDVWDDVTPTVAVPGGTPYEITLGYWGVPALDVAAGQLDAFRVSGLFDGVKVNDTDVVAIGTMMSWNGTNGFTIDVNGVWRAAKPSPAGDSSVLLSINAATGGGGGVTDPRWAEDLGAWDATTAIPAVGPQAGFYHVAKPATDQVHDFGSGNETINSAGRIWTDGTRWFWEPFGTAGGADRDFSSVATLSALTTDLTTVELGHTRYVAASYANYKLVQNDGSSATDWRKLDDEISVTEAEFAALTDAISEANIPVGSRYIRVGLTPSQGWKWTGIAASGWIQDDSGGGGSGTGTITAAEVKTLYEGNADTNAFTDTYKAQLDNLIDVNVITAGYDAATPAALPAAEVGDMIRVGATGNGWTAGEWYKANVATPGGTFATRSGDWTKDADPIGPTGTTEHTEALFWTVTGANGVVTLGNDCTDPESAIFILRDGLTFQGTDGGAFPASQGNVTLSGAGNRICTVDAGDFGIQNQDKIIVKYK